MSYFDQPILLMFLGFSGSGKSYFAKGIAEKMNAIRINGDSMRLAIFGSLEEIEKTYNSDGRHKVNAYTFNALDYVAEQILMRGNDLVYDALHNKKTDRENLEQLARKYDVLPIVVWVKTSHEVALQRGQTREAQADQRRLTEEKMREVIERHEANTDFPTPDELVITMDGQMPFEDQFLEFQRQLKELHD